MSIEPGLTYKSLSLYANKTLLWTLQGPFSADLTAGLLVGISILLDDINSNFHQEFIQHRVNIVKITDDKNIYLRVGEGRNFSDVLYDYIVAEGIELKDTHRYCPHIRDIGWWLWSPLDNRYTLFSFESADFIRGFMSICLAFNTDFRDYIIGTPFVYDLKSEETINYLIEGYDIEEVPLSYRRPAPVGAYYTGTYEADAYGEDFE